jgi:hypothetical protein
VLRIRTFPDRVIVDLDEDPFATDYVVLDETGATFTLSSQKVHLSWVAMRQFGSVVALAEKTFRRKGG